MLFTYVLLGLLMIFYTAVLTSTYINMGMQEIVSQYLYTITSIIIMFFSLFKSGSVIFNMQSYERTIALPISPSAIIISRFYTMYVSNLVLSVLVMLPSMIIYGMTIHPSISFYIYTVTAALFLPLLPMTISTAVSILILAVSSRMKHKNLAAIFLSITLTIGIIVLSTASSFLQQDIGEAQLINLSKLILNSVTSIYPPVRLYNNALMNNDVLSFLLLLIISIAIFSLFVFIVTKSFVSICTRLTKSNSKSDYIIDTLNRSSLIKTLYIKEIKRYFASSIYVMNTSVGYILSVVFAFSMLIMGSDRLDTMLGMPNITAKIIPPLLAAVYVISPTTACSISMEGKQWWIIKSLPVNARDVFNSKLLVNFTIALPCYIISEILLGIAFRQSFLQLLWTLLMPLIYIVFSAVVGLSINLKFPIFNWENETVVVKQSASTLICMVIGFVSVIAPFAAAFMLTDTALNIAYLLICAILLATTVILYSHNSKLQLTAIQ